MGVLKNYIIPRLCVYLLVIFIGCTLCFIIPRLTPLDPVTALVSRLSVYGQYYDPEALEQMIEALKELYGLKGSLLDQYIAFLKRVFRGDFGPSLTQFPTPATEVVYRSLPWTIGLLTLSTLISWILGNLIGGITGYFSERKWAKALSVFATVVYPVPYYIMALLLVMLFTYVLPWFPLYGGASASAKQPLSLTFIIDIIKHGFLPALSLVIVGYGWWFLSMRALVINTKTEDFVQFGEAAGLPQGKLLKYVIQNSLLPQVTGLAMSLGSIFNGALVTEVVFSYPGVGYILYTAITSGDFNLMMAIVTYSIIAVATAVLFLDLIYPLIDPRIRYR